MIVIKKELAMSITKYILTTITITIILVNPLKAEKKIVWQNTISRILDCQVIDSQNYVIVGDDGKIISTSDGGFTWRWLECGLRNIFYGVDFLDKNTGVVVGDGGAFTATTDGGETWRTETIDTTAFFSVEMKSKNAIFASGMNTCIYKSSDFGETWKKVFSGDNAVLENYFFFKDSIKTIKAYSNNSDIHFVNDSIGFAAGVGPFVLKTEDGGESWRKVLQKGDSALFTDIDFYDDKRGVAAGGDFVYNDSLNYGYLKAKAYYTLDGGENWIEMDAPGAGHYIGAKMFDSSYIYLLGGTHWSHITKDFGNSWRKIKFIDYKYFKNNLDTDNYKDTTAAWGSDYTPTAMSSDNEGVILSIDKQGVIMKSTNFGINYQTLKKFEMYEFIGHYFRRIHGFASLSENKALFFGEESKVYRTSDGGTSWDIIFPRYEIKNWDDKEFWSSISSSNASFYTSYLPDSANGFIAGKLDGWKPSNTIFTSDGGETWDIVNNLKSKSLSFISRDTGFAIGYDSLLLKTENFGLSWDTLRIFHRSGDYNERQLNNRPLQIVFPDSSAGYLIINSAYIKTNDTITYPTGYKGISKLYRTTDRWQTFDSIFCEETRWPFDKIHFMDKNTAYIFSGDHKTIYKTTDGCKTWDTRMLPGNYHFVNDVHFIDENFGVAVGRQDTIFTTRDGGKSWEIKVLPFNRNYFGDKRGEDLYDFIEITEAKNGDLFIVGKGRVVRGLIINDTTTVEGQTEGGRYCQFYYITIIPNPVKGTAKINLYGLTQAKGHKLSLKIYDINGNFVKDISKKANANSDGKTAEFEVNLHGLPSGIYFIQLESNSRTRSRKFIKY